MLEIWKQHGIVHPPKMRGFGVSLAGVTDQMDISLKNQYI